MSNAHMDLPLPIGTNRCRCSGCGEYFGSVGAFSRHRIGGVCRNPGDIGLVIGRAGYWVKMANKAEMDRLRSRK